MNKKGFYRQLNVVIVIGFVIGALIVFFYAGSLAFPIISDTGTTMFEVMEDASVSSNNQNLENATKSSFSNAKEGIQQLEWVAFTMIIMLMLTLVVMCFYVRTYPFLAFVWIFIMLILVFISIFLANAYQDVRVGELGDVYQSWESTDYLLRYLPHFITVLGIIGGIIMFMLASREPEAEGVYI